MTSIGAKTNTVHLTGNAGSFYVADAGAPVERGTSTQRLPTYVFSFDGVSRSDIIALACQALGAGSMYEWRDSPGAQSDASLDEPNLSR